MTRPNHNFLKFLDTLNICFTLRPEFFYFLVPWRAYPIFLKIQIKIKVPLQNFIFIFPSDCIISSPEPLGSQGELIVYPCSGVRLSSVRRPSTISNIFSSETTWPIKAKFYVEPPWEGGTKVYINGSGHMTKMAAMPIYGKNPSKIFSRTGEPIFTKLGI